MGSCCGRSEGKVLDKERQKKLQYDNDTTINNINTEDDEQNYFLLENKIYDDEDLLNMKIIDINFGIHKTEITSGSNIGNISFHPFFYVKLNNPNKIVVIIQYIKIEEKMHNLTHFWEENGVEYLEKKKKISN